MIKDERLMIARGCCANLIKVEGKRLLAEIMQGGNFGQLFK